MRWLMTGCLLLCGSACAGLRTESTPPRVAPSPYTVVQRFPLGGIGSGEGLAVEAATARIFVPRADRVLVVNLADGAALGATVADTPGVRAVTLAPDLGQGFAMNASANTVTVFDLGSLATVGTLKVKGREPDAMLYDPASGNLYTFNGGSRDAGVIDPARGVTLASIPLGGTPASATSDGAGRVFVDIVESAQLLAIDSLSSRRVATWPLPGCERPAGLALDVPHHRLFSVCSNGVLTVTDAESGRHVGDVAMGKGAAGIGFDPERKLIFTSNADDGTLTIIHEDDPDRYSVVDTLATQTGAGPLALDPRTHRIYLVATTGAQLMVVGN